MSLLCLSQETNANLDEVVALASKLQKEVSYFISLNNLMLIKSHMHHQAVDKKSTLRGNLCQGSIHYTELLQ